MLKLAFVGLMLAALATPARAQEADVFADGANGAKLHTASGFVCPLEIGHFGRDAVGTRDPEIEMDYCAYSARDGVYGVVSLVPIRGSYDPKALLAPDFVVQEGTGGRMIDESVLPLGPKSAPLQVYTRTYDTAKLETMHYRILFASAAVGNWAVQATIEFADPRDKDSRDDFLNAVYTQAIAKLMAAPQ